MLTIHRNIRRILEAVAENSDAGLRNLITHQTDCIIDIEANYKKRYYTLVKSDCFRRLSRISRFPNQKTYKKLATVDLKLDSVLVKSRINLASGLIADLSFPTRFILPDEMDYVEFVSVHFAGDLLDLVVPERPVSGLKIPVSEITDQMLRQLASLAGLLDVAAPLPKSFTKSVLRIYGLALPNDYKDLILHCNGLTAGPLTVLGLAMLYYLEIEEKSYCIIAETQKGGRLLRIGVLQKARKSPLFEIDVDGNIASQISPSFLRYCEEQLVVY